MAGVVITLNPLSLQTQWVVFDQSRARLESPGIVKCIWWYFYPSNTDRLWLTYMQRFKMVWSKKKKKSLSFLTILVESVSRPSVGLKWCSDKKNLTPPTNQVKWICFPSRTENLFFFFFVLINGHTVLLLPWWLDLRRTLPLMQLFLFKGMF